MSTTDLGNKRILKNVPRESVRNVHEISSTTFEVLVFLKKKLKPRIPDRFWKPVRSDSTLSILFHAHS